MLVKDRVFVETPLYSGKATITHIIQNELYSIQLLLDEPNESDGNTYRATPSEIRLLGNKKPVQTRYAHPIPERQKVELLDSWHVVRTNREVGVNKLSGVYAAREYSETAFMLYDLESRFVLGLYVKDDFSIIGSYHDYKNNSIILEPLQPVTAVLEAVHELIPEKPKKRSKVARMSVGEQLTLFEEADY